MLGITVFKAVAFVYSDIPLCGGQPGHYRREKPSDFWSEGFLFCQFPTDVDQRVPFAAFATTNQVAVRITLHPEILSPFFKPDNDHFSVFCASGRFDDYNITVINQSVNHSCPDHSEGKKFPEFFYEFG